MKETFLWTTLMRGAGGREGGVGGSATHGRPLPPPSLSHCTPTPSPHFFFTRMVLLIEGIIRGNQQVREES